MRLFFILQNIVFEIVDLKRPHCGKHGHAGIPHKEFTKSFALFRVKQPLLQREDSNEPITDLVNLTLPSKTFYGISLRSKSMLYLVTTAKLLTQLSPGWQPGVKRPC